MPDSSLIDVRELAATRAALGVGFGRILGYFQEDGVKSVAAIEQAMRNRDATALVLPAHTLKGESRQLGAVKLGDMAEGIEMVARRCVEHHEAPDELIEDVVQLRGCFEQTIAALNAHASPVPARAAGFGRRPAVGFGRA